MSSAYDIPLLIQLVTEDKKRDTILAQLSDAKLRDLAVSPPLWYTAEKKTEASINWIRRASRRNWEKTLGRSTFIPPGPWDEDLDKYHESVYTFDLGDGYKGSMNRNGYSAWNGYVILPEGHVCIGLSYDAFLYERPSGAPYVPFELTFAQDNKFGFDHAHYDDGWPYCGYSVTDYNSDGSRRNGKGKYLTFEDVKMECQELADYFKLIQREHADKFRDLERQERYWGR